MGMTQVIPIFVGPLYAFAFMPSTAPVRMFNFKWLVPSGLSSRHSPYFSNGMLNASISPLSPSQLRWATSWTMKTLCAILSLTAASGLVYLATSNPIVQNTATALFFAGLGSITLISIRRQPKLRRVAAAKK